jgi:predicted phosphodiesterase
MERTKPEIVAEIMAQKASGLPWQDIADGVHLSFGADLNAEACRGIYRRATSATGCKRTKGGEVVHIKEKHGTKLPTETDKRLLAIVKGKPKESDAVAQALGVSRNVLSALVADLKAEGYELQEEGGTVWLDTKAAQTDAERVEDWDGRRTIRFLAVSDTHLCSKYQQLTYLEEAYDDAIARGCDFAIHCGDLTDGFYQNRPGHVYEIFKLGYDEQLEYVVQKYPRRLKADGTPFITKIVSGNHDHTHMMADGANLVKAFSKQRDDVEFLGDAFCKLWITPNCDVDIQHPLDGSAYALSYSMQKMIDALQGGEKPKIMCAGHHHKAMYLSYRNIHAFEVPSLQAQTPFEKGKRIMAVVGWWIITVELRADGTVDRVVPELCQRYEMRKGDY